MLVDPLDGTREFLNRNGAFTVNIGLIENGSPVAGVVHAPALPRTFGGSVGKGAFKISSDERTNIAVRAANPDHGSRLHVAPCELLYEDAVN